MREKGGGKLTHKLSLIQLEAGKAAAVKWLLAVKS